MIIFFFFFLLCLSSFTTAQQPYAGRATSDCSIADSSTSVLGYSCNGLNKTCLTYVVFRSTPPFSTVSSISSLFSVNPSLLSSLNSASTSTSFPSGQQVIIPVTCSCSGGNYSQANLTYTIQPNDSYFFIANNTLQGLSTCQALERHNNVSSQSLVPGMRIAVPIRCACPTAKQVDKDGVNYLVSYTVVFGDTVAIISERFGVETIKTLEANELSFENPGVNPFTTLLIPLKNPPSDSISLISPPPPPPTPPRSVSPPLSTDGGKTKKTWVYVLAGVLGGALVLSVIGFAIFWFAKIKPRRKQETGNLDSFTEKKPPILDPLDGLSAMVVSTLKIYQFHELQSATSGFTSSNSIGGSWYVGKINRDGAMIKRIQGNASKEINLFSKLNHFNIIRLSGFCFHEGDWYLVYEHASNGSLSDWIYTKSAGSSLLSWTQRWQIALDIATGLNYLHNFANPPYVHRDLNSANIFLDTEFRAKIGNLGLARSTKDEDFALTRHVEGTRGYLAPEYLEHGLVSTKLDVYAFGVVLSEIITGKQAYELKKETDQGKEVEELLVLGGFLPKEFRSFVVRLVVDCLKKDHLNRPTMDEIVLSLSKISTASESWESSK